MDPALPVHREIQQQFSIPPDTLVVQIRQFPGGLDLVVLFRVEEPTRSDRNVTFGRNPGISVFVAGAQFLIGRIARIDLTAPQEGPVGLGGDTSFVSHPAATGTAVGENQRTGCPFIDYLMDGREIIIGPPVNGPPLRGAAIPAISPVGAIQPNFGHRRIIRQQFAQLIFIILHIFGRSVTRLMPVPRGKIDTELQAIFLAGRSQFADHIAFVWGGRYGIIRIAARPEAETIVVLGRDDHASDAGFHEGPGPLLAVQPGRIKDRRVRIAVAPLAVREGIGTEMDEGPNLILLPGDLFRRRDRIYGIRGFERRTGCEKTGEKPEEQLFFHGTDMLTTG